MKETLSSAFLSQGLRVFNFIIIDSNKTIENETSQCKVSEDDYKSKCFNSLQNVLTNSRHNQPPIKRAHSHTERNAWNQLSAQEGPGVHRALAGPGAMHSRTYPQRTMPRRPACLML